jgi:hypothetical protein
VPCPVPLRSFCLLVIKEIVFRKSLLVCLDIYFFICSLLTLFQVKSFIVYVKFLKLFRQPALTVRVKWWYICYGKV